jgi:Uma2 family endonuclease
MSISAARTGQHRMSPREFRAFQDKRPDHERWELIGGVPVMMVPPTIAHNRIAGNLERLLNDALATHNPARLANQRPGVELGRISDEYRPEPDLAVIDAEYEPGQRFVDRAYLLAEVVSATDHEIVPGTGETWIDVKRSLYRAHPPCEVVLIVEQNQFEVQIDTRTPSGWTRRTLTDPSDEIVLSKFGLRCRVSDLYVGTPLQSATGRHP